MYAAAKIIQSKLLLDFSRPHVERNHLPSRVFTLGRVIQQPIVETILLRPFSHSVNGFYICRIVESDTRSNQLGKMIDDNGV